MQIGPDGRKLNDSKYPSNTHFPTCSTEKKEVQLYST